MLTNPSWPAPPWAKRGLALHNAGPSKDDVRPRYGRRVLNLKPKTFLLRMIARCFGAQKESMTSKLLTHIKPLFPRKVSVSFLQTKPCYDGQTADTFDMSQLVVVGFKDSVLRQA